MAKSVAPDQQQTKSLFQFPDQGIEDTHTEELVIALCGPIGSPIHDVAKDLNDLLSQRYSYQCEIIRLSQLIERHTGKVETTSRWSRITKLIENGNRLRETYGHSVLADLAVHQIAQKREEYKEAKTSGNEKPFRRVCHIIDSVKNLSELEGLRLVYRSMFYSIGVFAPVDDRVKNLENSGLSGAEISKLIDRDSGEEFGHGQSVRNTFPQSDFFLRAGRESAENRRIRLQRFMDLILDVKIVTPTIDENAMYQAASAAGNSACLSRQVGAAITDDHGKLLSTGWNDVPKKGGGLYVSHSLGSTKDNRCIHFGEKCYNDEQKNKMATKIVKALIDSNLVSTERKNDLSSVIRDELRSLIEFSRSIHAEMHALILAFQSSGSSVVGGRLYCTTYPCHSCARHIVAAGILKVYYIEPYRKSMAVTLHGDSLTESESDPEKVRIIPFDGVSPNKFLELFKMKADSRKDESGNMIKGNPTQAIPKTDVSLESLPALEALVVNRLASRNLVGAKNAKE